MTPETRTLITGLLRNQLESYARDAASANLLAFTYHPDKPLAEGRAAIYARLDELEGAVHRALAEISLTPEPRNANQDPL